MMLGAGLQFGRVHGEDRFYNAAKPRRRDQHYNNRYHGKTVGSDDSASNRSSFSSPAEQLASLPSNLERFLNSTTPSVPACYTSEVDAMVRGRSCECKHCFALMDLWQSFKEWSAYGVGVPLVLNGRDGVVQYYVPYLSGIQLYGFNSSSHAISSRRAGEDSDSDFKDSSSDRSSDSEFDRTIKYLRDNDDGQDASMIDFDRLSLREKDAGLNEGFSSDDSDAGNSQGGLLFQYLEQDPPYCREPLADKVLDLARRFPVLRTLRSCDLLPESWISVAWYPIYRIPTGSTLRDLDACFLTFHSLSTLLTAADSSSHTVTSSGGDGVPIISLPTFGLASYKLKGSIWMPIGGCEWEQASSLLQAAHNWLKLLNVNHPDYQFFVSNGMRRR